MFSLDKIAALAGFIASTSAAAIDERQLFAPKAVIKNGTVIGSTDYLNLVDNFYGIPFAEQPTGTRRLANPVSITKAFGTFTATGTPISCPGYIFSTSNSNPVAAEVASALASNPLFQQGQNQGEACLNLNVQRTTGIRPGQKVPVLVYIYGGGFEFGSTGMYDGTPIVKKAASLGKPLIYVAISYRLAALGFLPGKEMAGNANLGLKDQRLGLKWIAENIAAFGGDPDKVTLWGESAGSISVFDQLIANGGNANYNGKALFHGAIMNSGCAVPALPISAPVNQAIYDQVVRNSGCSGARDTLACLRTVPTETFLKAQASLPGIFDYQSLHLAYFPRPDPSDSFYPVSPEEVAATGAFARVPIIIGDQEDEGTLFAFSQTNLTTNEDVIDYFQTWLPESPRSDVAKLVNSYPNDPAAGSPFRTGQNNNYSPQYKRVAAIAGDIVFTLTRRVYLSLAVANGVTAWSYLNTYLYGVSPIGTAHGSDIINNRNIPLSPIGQDATQKFYISFTYYQDPNRIQPNFNWPKWDNTNRKLLNFTQTAVLVGDVFRREQQYQTIASLAGRLRG